jgi:hypothetical protein
VSIELKTYLGDSVYAEYEPCDGSIKLTTENGHPSDPSNTIILDTAVLDCLEKFRARIANVEASAQQDSDPQEEMRSHAQAEAITNRFRDHKGPGER